MNLEVDLTIDEKLKEAESAAYKVFCELAPECDEGMEPSFVRYSYDMKKGTFYFKSDHRVDFRELVKKLNHKLGVVVEMRQIGDREQASLIGGLGPCGHELCCCRLGADCCCQKNSTIKMAKNQNLSLNPTKISGMCGRLMCCLRYENDFYVDFKSRSPKVNAKIKTPDGEGKVVSVDALHNMVSVRVGEEKARKINVDDFKEGSSSENGWEIGRSVWKEAGERLNDLSNSAVNVTIDTSLFTGNDNMAASHGAKLADKPAIEREEKKPSRPRRSRGSRKGNSNNTHAKEATEKKNSSSHSRVTARRPGGNSSVISRSKEEAKIERHAKDERKPRRRRTTKINTDK